MGERGRFGLQMLRSCLDGQILRLLRTCMGGTLLPSSTPEDYTAITTTVTLVPTRGNEGKNYPGPTLAQRSMAMLKATSRARSSCYLSTVHCALLSSGTLNPH